MFNTHTHTHIYIYMYVCMYMCYVLNQMDKNNEIGFIQETHQYPNRIKFTDDILESWDK